MASLKLWQILTALLCVLAGSANGQFDGQAEEPRPVPGGGLYVFADEPTPAEFEEVWAPSPRMTVEAGNLPSKEQILGTGVVYLKTEDHVAFTRELQDSGLDGALEEHLARGGVIVVHGAGAHMLEEEQLGLLQGVRFHLSPEAPPVAELQDGYVGVHMGPGSAFDLRRRLLRGSGPVSIQLAAGPGREGKTEALTRIPRDWLALTRAAAQRAKGPWPRDPARPREVPNGALMLVGGGSIAADIGRRFVELAGGPDAPVVYLPCSSETEISQEPAMCRQLRRWGFKNVTWVHTKDRTAANTDEAILAPLRGAKALWFGGGRQWNFVDSWIDTEAHRLMHEVLERGGAIGGSSAGASIQASYLCRGNPLGNRDIMSEGYERGLGFLPGCGVDQHFAERHRQRDLVSMVRTFPQLLGVGLDESTALVVQGSEGRVLGAGEVWLYEQGAGADRVERHSAGQSFDLNQGPKAPQAGPSANGALRIAHFLLLSLENFSASRMTGVNWLPARPLNLNQEADRHDPDGPALANVHVHSLQVTQLQPTTPLQPAAFSVNVEMTLTNGRSADRCEVLLEDLSARFDKHNGDLAVQWEGLVRDEGAKSLYVASWTVDLRLQNRGVIRFPPEDPIGAVLERCGAAGFPPETLEIVRLEEEEEAGEDSPPKRPRYRLRQQGPGLSMEQCGNLLMSIGAGKDAFWIADIHIQPAPAPEPEDGLPSSTETEALWSFEAVVEYSVTRKKR